MSDFNLIAKPSMSAAEMTASNDFVMVAHRPPTGLAVDCKMTIAQFSTLIGAGFTASGLFSLAVQAISGTGSTAITSSNVVCSGSTTAPQLPAVASGLQVAIKNMGSGNCVITGTGSAPIVPLNSVSTGATTLTLATTVQAILFCDGTNWYQLA